MKLLKSPALYLAVLALFAVFLLGLFLGRTTGRETLYFAPAPTERAQATEPPETIPEDGKIDVNTAPAAVLATLPSIGEVIAERIVAFRQEHGPFRNIEELTDVEGIGEKRLSELRDYLTVR